MANARSLSISPGTLPTQSGAGVLPRVARNPFNSVRGLSSLYGNAGSFGLQVNAADVATSPSVPTGSSNPDVGQAGSVGNVTPPNSPGYNVNAGNAAAAAAQAHGPSVGGLPTWVLVVGAVVATYFLVKA